MFGKIMHVNGGSLYKTYDTPRKTNLIGKHDVVGLVRSSQDENQVIEDISLTRIFSKLSRGEELTEAEMNYVRLHDAQLYQDISTLYVLRADVLKAFESLTFEEASLFMKKEKSELSKNLQKAYQEREATSSEVRILEWYYSLLDRVWYRYLKQREEKTHITMSGKRA